MKKRIIIKKSISISKQLSEPSRYTFMGVKGMHPVALLLALSLSACSDSGSNFVSDDVAPDNVLLSESDVTGGVQPSAPEVEPLAEISTPIEPPVTVSSNEPEVVISEVPVVNPPAINVVEEQIAEPPVLEEPAVEAPPAVTTVEAEVAPPVPVAEVSNPDNVVPSNGVDASAGDDDSPTFTETLSLVGPFVKDESRSAGPPSVPQGLTPLLASHNWVEFSWAPSADDQSVEEYEVFRDGVSIFNVRGDTNNDLDYRHWITTSYTDCDYTRYGCTDNAPASGGQHVYTVTAIDNEGMRSAQSAPVSYTLPARQQSTPPDLSGFNLVFDEEFNGDSLDRSRWKTSLPWGPDQIINVEQQYFVNTFGANPPDYDPFVFTGETLQITGIPTPPELLSQANNQPYLSGVITTADHFEMTYGYVEMRARVAGGAGLLSTFFLFNQNFDGNQPEIDILEYIGDRPNKAFQTYHYYDSNRFRYASGEKHSSPTMEFDAGTNLSAGFHDYSVLWEPELVIWYIDGIEVQRIEGPRVSDEPMNIIAQLVLGSIWIGSPTGVSFPVTYEIDYIKAWQE